MLIAQRDRRERDASLKKQFDAHTYMVMNINKKRYNIHTDVNLTGVINISKGNNERERERECVCVCVEGGKRRGAFTILVKAVL